MKNKKNHIKKISENNFYSKAKIFREKIFTKKSRNDSVAAGHGKGVTVYYSNK